MSLDDFASRLQPAWPVIRIIFGLVAVAAGVIMTGAIASTPRVRSWFKGAKILLLLVVATAAVLVTTPDIVVEGRRLKSVDRPLNPCLVCNYTDAGVPERSICAVCPKQ
jgi:uncharacterized membrane protein YhaH (DUF805 family)